MLDSHYHGNITEMHRDNSHQRVKFEVVGGWSHPLPYRPSRLLDHGDSSSEEHIRTIMSLDTLMNPEPDADTSSSSGSSVSSLVLDRHYHRRRRSSSEQGKRKTTKPHGPRPKYTKEQQAFIWYHRTDLSLEWHAVHERYLQHFSSRELGGLQCKFYRCLDDWGVAKIRKQNSQPWSDMRRRSSEAARLEADQPFTAMYGVTDRTDLVYSWMSPEHRHRPVRTGSAARLVPPFRKKAKKPKRASKL